MPTGNKNMLTFAGRSLRDGHVVCRYDNDKEYDYEVDLVETIKEIAWAQKCHTRRAYKMLKRASMELPVRGCQCNYWME